MQELRCNNSEVNVARLMSQRDGLKKDLAVARYWALYDGWNEQRSNAIEEIEISISETETAIRKHAYAAAVNGEFSNLLEV